MYDHVLQFAFLHFPDLFMLAVDFELRCMYVKFSTNSFRYVTSTTALYFENVQNCRALKKIVVLCELSLITLAVRKFRSLPVQVSV